MNSSENDKLRTYKIRYVADDGEIRWLTVEAKDADDAERQAFANDMTASTCAIFADTRNPRTRLVRPFGSQTKTKEK